MVYPGLALGMFRAFQIIAILLTLTLSMPAVGQVADRNEVSMDALFAQLAQADDSNWRALEKTIQARWARSGSEAMDLLYARGRKALEQGDLPAALDHLGALTDHAPDFAEGWHLRATALFRAERFGMALAALRHVLALEPRHFDAMEGVAVVMETLNEPDRALHIYRQILTIHPRNRDVKEAVARLEQTLGATL